MPDLKRRDFLKLVGVSAGGAAAAGCSDHVEKLIPYVVQPEEITPGTQAAAVDRMVGIALELDRPGRNRAHLPSGSLPRADGAGRRRPAGATE